MTELYIILLIILLIAFTFYLKKINNKSDNMTKNSNQLISKKNRTNKTCLLCGSQLQHGEKMRSKEIQGKSDSIIHIRGCNNCYGANTKKEKHCPICKCKLLADEYIIGRMWKTKKGKLHLHINGCKNCRNTNAIN